jgi:hypothetical protein
MEWGTAIFIVALVFYFGWRAEQRKQERFKEVDRETERRRAERQAEQAEANAWKRHNELRDEIRRQRWS